MQDNFNLFTETVIEFVEAAAKAWCIFIECEGLILTLEVVVWIKFIFQLHLLARSVAFSNFTQSSSAGVAGKNIII